jgi:hypothetical protein
MSDVSSADYSADRFEGGANEAIARGIDRKIIEAAGDQATRQELMALCFQRIDAPSDTVQNRFARNITSAELSSLSLLHGVREHFGDEVGKFVRAIFEPDHPCPSRSEQVRRVKHQQPEIADGYSPDVAVRGCRRACRCFGGVHHYNPCLRRSIAFSASAGASNQYSARSGPMSVSMTSRNHAWVSPASSGYGGVT